MQHRLAVSASAVWEKTAHGFGGLAGWAARLGSESLRSGRQWPPNRKAVMSVIRRHPVLTFFLLAYALCWAAIPWQSFFAPGVLVAAVIVVSLTEGVAGLKTMGSRLIRWRVSWIWYAIAIAVPLAVKFAAIGLNGALGAPVPDIAEFSVWYSLPMAIAINIVNPLNAQLPEEASFRGWAQPKLQTTRTPLAATVLMAVGVTIWHIPFFLMPQFGSSPVEAGHRRGHLLVRLAVQPRLWSSLITLIAHATEGTIETSTLWLAAGDTTRMTWLNEPGLVRRGPGSAGVRPPVLDQATRSRRARPQLGTSRCHG